jgi:hypothetical protein
MHSTSIIVEAAVAAAAIMGGAALAWRALRQRDKFAPAWKPLLAIVGGQSRAGRLTGNFADLPVQARIAEAGDGAHFWELSVTPPAGRADWSLTYTGQKFLGSGAKAWRIKSKDDDLASRMNDAGALELIRGWAVYPEIDYKVKSGLLTYREQVDGPYAIPASEPFRAQLDLLIKLAEISRKAGA